MKSKINLHIHTTYSDGGKSVPQVMQELVKAGVTYFSITDHDQVVGNVEAAELALQHGLQHVSGIELSCCFGDNEIGLDESYFCHIVGLDIDIVKMQAELDRIFEEKGTKLFALCLALIDDGYMINIDDIRDENGRVMERTRIAFELVRQNYVHNLDEAFLRILNNDKYRKYANNIPSIKVGIEIIKKCGGLAIWAHPFDITRGGKKPLNSKQVNELFDKMDEYGIDGIEVYYQKFDKDKIEFLNDLANSKNLLKSIATDYHCAQFDEKKHLELLKYREKESIIFNVDNIVIDESIVDVLFKNK